MRQRETVVNHRRLSLRGKGNQTEVNTSETPRSGSPLTLTRLPSHIYPSIHSKPLSLRPRYISAHFRLMYHSPPIMPSYTCQTCDKSFHSYVEGDARKPTIRIRVTWQAELLTVVNNGEICYPCPRCEEGSSGICEIKSWDNAEVRLHKRLRQHFHRHHQAKLSKTFSSEGIAAFYEKARKLRCDLLNGPSIDAQVECPATPEKSLPLPKPRTPGTGRYESSKFTNSVDVPASYKDWLQTELKLASVTGYISTARKYLAYIQFVHNVNPAITDAWNYDWVSQWIEDLKKELAPTTVFNSLCGISSMQKFSQLHAEYDPPSKLMFKFKSLMRSVSRLKDAHRLQVRADKSKHTTRLYDLQKKLFEDPAVEERYESIVKQAKAGLKVKPGEYQWALGYAILNLQASNFKRNGNLLKLTHSKTMKKLGRSLRNGTSAELEIEDATKTGGREIFSIVSQKKQKVIWNFGQYIRQSRNGNPSFFTNSKGGTVKHIAIPIKIVGKSVGLAHLTIKDLRSRIETEAARSDSTTRKEICDHLAHTELTRDKHYLFADKRRSSNAARSIERLMEAAQPSESEGDTEAEDGPDATIEKDVRSADAMTDLDKEDSEDSANEDHSSTETAVAKDTTSEDNSAYEADPPTPSSLEAPMNVDVDEPPSPMDADRNSEADPDSPKKTEASLDEPSVQEMDESLKSPSGPSNPSSPSNLSTRSEESLADPFDSPTKSPSESSSGPSSPSLTEKSDGDLLRSPNSCSEVTSSIDRTPIAMPPRKLTFENSGSPSPRIIPLRHRIVNVKRKKT